jgi:hypothetical protein
VRQTIDSTGTFATLGLMARLAVAVVRARRRVSVSDSGRTRCARNTFSRNALPLLSAQGRSSRCSRRTNATLTDPRAGLHVRQKSVDCSRTRSRWRYVNVGNPLWPDGGSYQIGLSPASGGFAGAAANMNSRLYRYKLWLRGGSWGVGRRSASAGFAGSVNRLGGARG